MHQRTAEWLTHTDMLRDAMPTQTYAAFSHLVKAATRWDWAYVGIIDMAMHKPSAEYVARLGLVDCIWHRDKWEKSMVRLTKRKPHEVLPLDQNELARIRDSRIALKPWMLIIPFFARKYGQPIKLERWLEAGKNCVGVDGYRCGQPLYDLLTKHGKQLRLTRIVRYLRRLTPNTLCEWCDYINMLMESEPTMDEVMLFPKDAHRAHEQMIVRYKAVKAERFNEKVAKRGITLAKDGYVFRFGGMTLQPFCTTKEIIEEGTRQSICIGSYVEKYAEGKTVLCKLRRDSAPDEPWHAVEFTTNGRLVQCRGYQNKTYKDDEDDVRAFWAAWDAARGTDAHEHLWITVVERPKKKEATPA